MTKHRSDVAADSFSILAQFFRAYNSALGHVVDAEIEGPITLYSDMVQANVLIDGDRFHIEYDRTYRDFYIYVYDKADADRIIELLAKRNNLSTEFHIAIASVVSTRISPCFSIDDLMWMLLYYEVPVFFTQNTPIRLTPGCENATVAWFYVGSEARNDIAHRCIRVSSSEFEALFNGEDYVRRNIVDQIEKYLCDVDVVEVVPILAGGESDDKC